MFSTYLNSELKNVKRLLGTRFYQILAFLMAKPSRINTERIIVAISSMNKPFFFQIKDEIIIDVLSS